MNNADSNSQPYGGIRELLRVAWPLIISTGTFALLHFCDRMFLSRYSEVTFRAALPAGILFFTLTSGFVALAAFTNTFVAQYWGADDKEGCAKATAQGIFFSILSFPLVWALVPFGLFLFRITGQDEQVIQLEEQYLKILMWAAFGMISSSAIGSFFSGRGKTRVIMSCNVLANLVNIALDYAMIFGKWGFPEMGISGAGWATVIGSFVNPVIMALLIYTGKLNREYGARRNFRFDKWLFLRMIKFGIPAGLHRFLDMTTFTLFVLYLGTIGAVAQVAGNMALSINLVVFMPMVGLGIAASILVGQYLGRNQPEYAERITWTTTKIGVTYTFLVGLTFIFTPDIYIYLFLREGAGDIPHETIIEAVRYLLIMMLFWGVFDAIGIILSGALKGAGDTHFVMWFHTSVAWLVLAAGQTFLVFKLKVGLFVSWGWTVFYILLLAIGFSLRFKSGRWKKIDLLDRRPTVLDDQVPAEH